MTTRARTSRPLLALLLPLGLVLTGCGGSDDGAAAPSAPASSTGHHDGAAPADGHDEAADHGRQHGGKHSGKHGGKHGAGHGKHAAGHGEPAAVLLRQADLPRGWRTGHAHATAPTGDEPTPASCRPLAQLLRQPGAGHTGGTGHTGHTGGPHQAATVAFTRSHVGPTITQTVVDVGGFGPAAAAVRRVEATATRCDEYVQSTSRIGANTYAVAPLEAPADAEPGAYLRLTAQGVAAGPDRIHWDLWVHDCEGMLVAVTFRSALGGDNADFWPAVSAAMDRVHGT